MGKRPITLPKEWKGITGYVSDPRNASSDKICRPSKNCFVTKNGYVETRFGYLKMDWDLGLGENATKPYYHEAYDVTVFFGGGKVQYVDHNNNGKVVDTGATLTAGTVTRADEFLGDEYYSNTTDGLNRGVFGRLNDASADSGDGSVFVDVDMAARLSVFSKTTGDIVIDGDSYAYNAVNVSTGEITLNAVTLSKDYSDNTVCFVHHDVSSGREKFSKVLFWSERLMGMGFPSATNADQPNNSVMVSKFVIGEVGASGIEDIIDFTYGTGGATKITVGKGGKLTNILGVQDYIYFFKQNEAYNTAKGDISKSGSSIGLTIPDLKDENYGCLNEDSAIAIGNNELAYITNDKRIMRIRLSETGSAVAPFPDESFDRDIWLDLEDMDDEQPLGMAYFYKSQRKSIFQVALNGQYHWLIYDHIIDAWQPPQLILPVNGFFERKGVLYVTSDTNDDVFAVFTAFDDDGVPIECTVATPEFQVNDAMVRKANFEGIITQSTTIELKAHVTNNAGGRRSTSANNIVGSNYTYGENRSIGAVPIGGSSNAITSEYSDWKKSFDIYPQEGYMVQLTAYCFGDHFGVSRYNLDIDQYFDNFQKTI